MSEKHARPVLVFQMAKVASRSWVRLLEETVPDRPRAHFHSMSDMSLDRIDRAVQQTGAGQTIKHLSLPRLGRPPVSIAHHVQGGRWTGPGVDIVAGVRDPVARAVSVVAFLSNRLGYSRYGVTARDGGTSDTLRRLFHRVLHAARAGELPEDDTFVRVLTHAVFDYRRWFSEELAPGFGLALAPVEFNRDVSALTMDAGEHRLLVYRVEDLIGEQSRLRVASTASRFFRRPIGPVPPEDTSGETRFRVLYKDFVASVSLSDDDLDWFYDVDVIRTFYSASEIASFRARWSR